MPPHAEDGCCSSPHFLNNLEPSIGIVARRWVTHNQTDIFPSGITNEDGKLRWSYAINLWRQPILLYPLVKIMAVFLVIVVISATATAGVAGLLWALAGGSAFTLTVVGLTYLIMALVHRGRYVILFEMDETGVLHQTEPRQNKKARSLGVAAILIGRASGIRTISDVGVNAGGSVFYSRFAQVKTVKAVRKYDLIRVNAPFVWNQIYASPEQYGFVWEYITSRCKGAKVYGDSEEGGEKEK